MLAQFRQWLEGNVIGLPPQAPLAKAFGYALRHWEALIRYTENGILLPDNNALERQIRPIALGRANWTFAGSPRGARAAATMYSLLGTARLNAFRTLCVAQGHAREAAVVSCQSRARTIAARPLNAFTFMDILDSLRQAPSADLYRLYLAIGKMLDDPRRILEVRQRLHLGMAVSYIGDNPLGPPSQGTVVELRHAQAIVQDSVSRRRWALLVCGDRCR